MLRKLARQRKDYLHRKGLEKEEISKYEKKQKIAATLGANKKLPNELRNEERSLRQEMELEDDRTAVPKSHMDDEYAGVGSYDPRVLMTTCRNPSSRLMRFLKEMKFVFPNSTRTNRGNYLLPELVKQAIKFEFTDIVIFHEHRGKPDGMIVSHLPSGPTAYFGLSNVIMRHDLAELPDNMSLEYPHLIFHAFQTTLGDRVSDILKYLFPVPKLESKRVISFINKEDYIVFRHHTYGKEAYNKVDLTEVGPRFCLKLFKIQLGTVDMTDAETEWVLRPYMNSAKKRKFL